MNYRADNLTADESCVVEYLKQWPNEFISKIETCAQEADETLLWLELLRDDCNIRSNALDILCSESNELISIFVTMSKNAKKNLRAET